MSGIRYTFLLAVLCASVLAVTETVDIVVPELEYWNEGNEYNFRIDGYGSTGEAFLPKLPSRIVFYEIPVDATSVSVELSSYESTIMTNIEEVEEAIHPMPYTPDSNYTVPERSEHGLNEWPEEVFRYTGVKNLNGRRLVSIQITPVQYFFNTHEAEVVTEYNFRISYDLPPSALWTFSQGDSGAIEDLASEIIENHGQAILTSGLKTSLAQGVDVKYAIITSSTFESILQELADWKSQKGVPAKIYNTTWIYANYTGYDNAEKIRNLLVDLETQYDLDYVVLAGDVDDVPTRSTWIADGSDTRVPSDYYFADLEGNYSPYDWDMDNDSVFGETGDNIDWMPEVYVGRLSAANSGQMQTLVDNIIDYEKTPSGGSWSNKAITAGGEADASTDDALLMKFIIDDFLNSTMTYERINYLTNYPRDYSLTYANFQSRVGTGTSLINWAGHGNYYLAVPKNGVSAFVSTSTNPSNNAKRPVVYANSCSTGGFDQTTCLGEDIIRNWGIAFIGGSRVTWYNPGWNDPNDPYNSAHTYRFNEQLIGNNKYNIGQALYDSKVDYIQDFDPFSYDPGTGMHYASRKNLLAYNLLGDPELNIWTAEPPSLSVTHDAEFMINSTNSFIVNVTDNGSFVENATVTITNGVDVYETALTDSGGSVTFNAVAPNSGEPIKVTAVKQNYVPAQGDINATDISVIPLGPMDQEFLNPTYINFTYIVNSSYDIQWCKLYMNGIVRETDTNITVNVSQLIQWNLPVGGVYSWYIKCRTPSDIETSSAIQSIGVIEMENFDGNSTDLESEDLENITNLIIEKSQYGMINFTDTINLSGGANLDSYVSFDINRIEVRSDYVPELNKPAILTIRGISYHNPVIMRNDYPCGTCNILEVGADYVTFSVMEFSVYSVTGSLIDIIRTGTLNTTTEGNATAQGGNMTNVNLTTMVSTDRWQGFYGNATGTLQFGYGNYVFYAFSGSQEIAVYGSRNYSFDFDYMENATAADVDAVWNYSSGNDQAVDVFTGALTNISGVLAPSVELNPSGQNLNSTILDMGANYSKGSYAFGAIIQPAATCFDGTLCDFELLVPADGQEIYYLFLEVS